MSDARVITSRMALAVGRFRQEGVLGYRAATMPAAPLRASRVEATADELLWLDDRNTKETR